jgi:hypothetical protein
MIEVTLTKQQAAKLKPIEDLLTPKTATIAQVLWLPGATALRVELLTPERFEQIRQLLEQPGSFVSEE